MMTLELQKRLVRQVMALFLTAAVVAGASPARAQLVTGEDALFTVKALDGEFFRSADNQVTLGLRVDAAGALTVATMTVSVKTQQGDQEMPVEPTEQVTYDPVARSFRASFRRNEGRVKALDGVLAAEAREFHHLRTFKGTLTYDSGRTVPVAMIGSLNALMGKPGCVFDLFAGASLASVTLKRPYEAGKPDWLQPVAAAHQWTVLRRRIDYVRAEEEYDIHTGAGRELAALSVIRTLPDVACLSFGADEGDRTDVMRITGLPRGSFIRDAGPADAALVQSKIAPAFAGAAVTVQPPGRDGDYAVQVRAPGRLFGMSQFAGEAFVVTLSLQPGLAPSGAGEIRDMVRIGVKSAARIVNQSEQAIDLKTPAPGSTDVLLQEWLPRTADILATTLGGTLN